MSITRKSSSTSEIRDPLVRTRCHRRGFDVSSPGSVGASSLSIAAGRCTGEPRATTGGNTSYPGRPEQPQLGIGTRGSHWPQLELRKHTAADHKISQDQLMQVPLTFSAELSSTWT
jgi:hypothetical protein